MIKKFFLKFMFSALLFTFIFPNAKSLKIILLSSQNCDTIPLVHYINENRPEIDVKLLSDNPEVKENDLIFMCTTANRIKDLETQLDDLKSSKIIFNDPNSWEYNYSRIIVVNIRKDVELPNEFEIFRLEEFDNDLIEKIAEIQNYNKFEFPEEKKSIISYIKIKEEEEKIEEIEEENINTFENSILKLGKMCNCEYQSFLEQFRNNFTEEEQKYIYSYDQYSYASRYNLYKTTFNMFAFNKYNVLKKIIK